MQVGAVVPLSASAPQPANMHIGYAKQRAGAVRAGAGPWRRCGVARTVTARQFA